MAGDVITASGTRVFIGAAATSVIDTIAEFEAISGWTEIGLVESVGEYGDQANKVTFEAVGDGRVRKSKGARDAGTLAIVCGHDPTDAGQAALIAAEATNNNYAFKVILPDGPVGYSDTIQYFRGLVMGKRLNVGNNENIVRRNFSVEINSEVLEDPAST
jgi:hypothetical protein